LIKWNNESISESSLDFQFHAMTSELGLYQFVKNPTLNINILDLIIASSDTLISDVNHLPPIASSDHDSLSFKILTHENVKNPGETPLMTRNFRKADYVGIEQFFTRPNTLSFKFI